ncbi:unnamed protein product [Pedinophyceae sp. YPF-701]|nr:unnamed protein product [Pedinophyceae sp. YPF-701]
MLALRSLRAARGAGCGLCGLWEGRWASTAAEAYRLDSELQGADPPVELPTFVGDRRAAELRKRPLAPTLPLAEAIAWARERAVELSKQRQEKGGKGLLGSLDVHFRLSVDPKKGDQVVRGAAVLPHSTGKAVRVAVFAEGSAAQAAIESGADVVGGEELIEEISRSAGKSVDFDKTITTPAMMPRVAKVARILGPRGLMPNAKLGTVTQDVGPLVAQMKKGRAEFRVSRERLICAGLGRVSEDGATDGPLAENLAAYTAAILDAKPKAVKAAGMRGYISSVRVCTTFGPSALVDLATVERAVRDYRAKGAGM